MSSSPDMQILELPSGVSLSLLAEGAANIVYRLTLPPPSPGTHSLEGDDYGPGTPPPGEISPLRWDPKLEGKLLRLRKDLPTATSVMEAQKSFEELIQPHFDKDCLVEQVLVRLPEGMIHNCNEELKGSEIAYDLFDHIFKIQPGFKAGSVNEELMSAGVEATRDAKRHGVYLNEKEPFGTLVTDMTQRDGDVFTLEFKPKWLEQSPSAPKGARRCRTCALRAMRGNAKSPAAFCPLDLVSGHEARITPALDGIIFDSEYGPKASPETKRRLMEHMKRLSALHTFEGQPVQDENLHENFRSLASPETRRQLVKHLKQLPLLSTLKRLQTSLDSRGVFDKDAGGRDYCTAMTLRDCTLYLRVSPESVIEARLGDLDLKSPSKVEDWKSIERRLIDEGWYAGKKEQADAMKCSLAR